MQVLGIDPSLRSTGYAILEGDRNRQRVIEYGVIKTPAKEPLDNTLDQIADSLEKIIKRYLLDVMSIEDIFVAKNSKVALNMGHVRGVVIQTCTRLGIPVTQYSATRIKETVAGYGRADKEQIQHMVMRTLSLEKKPPKDASDAMAAALTHFFWSDTFEARR